jgi:catechol 2,3-dioxygenase-like lactoylglutathione lyase family enzyme
MAGDEASRFTVGLSELVLIVDDVRASARFYADVVGLLPETEADDEWAWFFAGARGLPQRIALHRGPLGFEEFSPHPEGERWGQVHLALEVPRERLRDAVEHVASQGVDVHGPVRLGWMSADAYYFFDPDGNLIEFWSPDPPRVGEPRVHPR